MGAIRRTRQLKETSPELEPKRDTSFCDLVLDQLAGLPELLCQPMFGGFGLYCGEDFFGVIADGRLYFLTDDTTRKTYIARGMEPFRPSERQTLSSYYEVPLDVLENGQELERWARQAVLVRGKMNRTLSRKRRSQR